MNKYGTFYNTIINEIKIVQQEIPLVGDRALIDLVNGLSVNKDILRYWKNRKFWGWLFDKIGGDDEQRRLLYNENILVGQETLINLAGELSQSIQISQLALQDAQKSLLEARKAIRQHSEDLNFLYEQMEKVVVCLNDHEERIQSLELSGLVEKDFDRIITAWSSNQTYSQLPWILQVLLLSQEIFSSSVAVYESKTQDFGYRQRLVGKIFAQKVLPERQKLLRFSDVLNDLCTDPSEKDLLLSYALIDVRAIPQQRALHLPHTFTIGTALELLLLPTEIRPNDIGLCASELCRQQIGTMDRAITTEKLVTALVAETADDCLLRISQEKE